MGASKKSDFKEYVIPVLQLQFLQIPGSPDKIKFIRYRHSALLQPA